jgi:hypothetical protein
VAASASWGAGLGRAGAVKPPFRVGRWDKTYFPGFW